MHFMAKAAATVTNTEAQGATNGLSSSKKRRPRQGTAMKTPKPRLPTFKKF